MSDTKISREEAQAEIDGLVVAEICRDFGTNFYGVYPDHILARGVGPEQAFIGLAIKRGHLAAAARVADLERQLAEALAKLSALPAETATDTRGQFIPETKGTP